VESFGAANLLPDPWEHLLGAVVGVVGLNWMVKQEPVEDAEYERLVAMFVEREKQIAASKA
jgi:hypothetical protein